MKTWHWGLIGLAAVAGYFLFFRKKSVTAAPMATAEVSPASPVSRRPGPPKISVQLPVTASQRAKPDYGMAKLIGSTNWADRGVNMGSFNKLA